MFKDDTVGFYRQNKQIHSKYHNKPPYVTNPVYNVELRKGLVDPGSSLNTMPLSPLEAVGISREHPIEISRLGGDTSLTLGYINVGVEVGPNRAATLLSLAHMKAVDS